LYINIAMSFLCETEFEICTGLGQLALLKFFATLLKYLTFEGFFLIFSWAKQIQNVCTF
jgi:hypothetical protein